MQLQSVVLPGILLSVALSCKRRVASMSAEVLKSNFVVHLLVCMQECAG